jgi:adenylate cyclase
MSDPIRTYRVASESVSRAPSARFSAPTKPSIAVLPFDNMSDDHAQEYFSDGIAEDLTTALSRFEWLFVIARNSAFTGQGRRR